jgi:hypothetical protein
VSLSLFGRRIIRIPRRVTKRVVDGLEIVEVKIKNRERVAALCISTLDSPSDKANGAA